MDGLTSIRMFVAAYEEGTFTAAAVRENATQSGVSQHVGQLERTLGLRLFLRGKTGVKATPAGDNFYVRCIELLRAHHDALRAASEYGHGLTGEVTVGLMPTLTQVALAPALRRFTTENPNVRMLVIEGYSAFLAERLLAGEMDLAIIPASRGHRGMLSRHFATVPEVLIASADAGGPDKKMIALRDLPPLKLIVPSRQNTRRNSIEAYCASHGGRIERVLELDSVSGTLDLVAQSDWQAILPLPAVISSFSASRFTVNRIAAPAFDLGLNMIAPASRNLSVPAERFRDMLETVVTELTEEWLENCTKAA